MSVPRLRLMRMSVSLLKEAASGSANSNLHSGHILTGKDEQLFTGGEFGGQHFSESRGQPRYFRLCGEITEADDGDRAPSVNGRNSGRRRLFSRCPQRNLSKKEEPQENCCCEQRNNGGKDQHSARPKFPGRWSDTAFPAG